MTPRGRGRRLVLAGGGWLVLIGLVISLASTLGPELLSLLQDEERLREALAEWELLGPLVFIGLQVLQVVVFIIPGEVVQIAGGYLYGPWLGLIYSLIGIGLGSAGAFFIGRGLGRPFVEALLRQEAVQRLDRLLSRGGGVAALFLLFLLPGVPKDALCYVAGLSAIPFLIFLGVSLLGRLPALLISVVFGSELAQREWPVVIAIAVGAGSLLLLSWFFRRRLSQLYERLLARLGARVGGPEEGGAEGE